ncbi:MAG: hypothetical protein FWD74_03415 [Actinomycetia bacterium]|nr:hypothetical protein [Actinomycetes bacterium]
MLYYNKDFAESDLIIAEVVHHFNGPGEDRSEFGFSWDRLDGTMGQPRDTLITDWADLDSYRFPDPADPTRFRLADEKMAAYGPDKYYVASLSLSGFTVMSFLRGFADTLMGLYEEETGIQRLADGVFGFEEEVIRRAAGRGFSAVGFFDDWGTQNNLIISPDLWREFFKPYYQRQFDLCHQLGLDVYFHCCGHIQSIIGDFIELGVDILNVSQPNVFDIAQLGQEFGSQVCFMCPVSYQTTALSGTKDDIYAAVRTLKDNLARPDGGLIGYLEEYHSIGLSDQNYEYCKSAWREIGVY